MNPSNARERIASLVPELVESRIAFKKLDSLLRGNSYAELAACCREGLFGAVYIAPAFPAQGRVTLGGRQFVVGNHAPIDISSICDALEAESISAELARSAAELPSSGIVVCDAATDQDLQDWRRRSQSRAPATSRPMRTGDHRQPA